MKMPKEIRTICPFCKKHTVHEVKESKKHKASAMKRGARAKKKRPPGHGNKGRFSRRPLGQWKMTGWSTPRRDLRLECKECGRQHPRKKTFRAKKFEVTRR